MIPKSDPNFGQKLTFYLKKAWEIWWILTRAVESLKICTFLGYFSQKYVMSELKKYRGIVSWKMTYGFKNDKTNLVNFDTSSCESNVR